MAPLWSHDEDSPPSGAQARGSRLAAVPKRRDDRRRVASRRTPATPTAIPQPGPSCSSTVMSAGTSLGAGCGRIAIADRAAGDSWDTIPSVECGPSITFGAQGLPRGVVPGSDASTPAPGQQPTKALPWKSVSGTGGGCAYGGSARDPDADLQPNWAAGGRPWRRSSNGVPILCGASSGTLAIPYAREPPCSRPTGWPPRRRREPRRPRAAVRKSPKTP